LALYAAATTDGLPGGDEGPIAMATASVPSPTWRAPTTSNRRVAVTAAARASLSRRRQGARAALSAGESPRQFHRRAAAGSASLAELDGLYRERWARYEDLRFVSSLELSRLFA